MNGGEGDDTIRPGSDGYNQTVRGGKGNDKINVYEGSDLYDANGDLVTSVYEANVTSYNDGLIKYDGGDGDDEIWAQYEHSDSYNSEGQRLYGGNGDDVIKGGWEMENGLIVAG